MGDGTTYFSVSLDLNENVFLIRHYWLRVKIGLQNAYRSRMKKSIGLSCIVNGVYVSPNILYPKFCWVIKGNRRGYFETRGGGCYLKLTSDYRGGGYVQWGVI